VVSNLGHAFWYATPENEWKQLFWRYLPKHLVVDDLKALKGYYEESSDLLYRHISVLGLFPACYGQGSSACWF